MRYRLDPTWADRCLKKLKTITKKFRAEAHELKEKVKSYEEKLIPIAKELGLESGAQLSVEQLKQKIQQTIQPPADPYVDQLKALGRASGVEKSHTFNSQIMAPMHQQLQDWIADLSQYMNCDPKALAEWQQTVLSGDPRSADGPWLAENLNTLWNNKLIDQTAYRRIELKAMRVKRTPNSGQERFGGLF